MADSSQAKALITSSSGLYEIFNTFLNRLDCHQSPGQGK